MLVVALLGALACGDDDGATFDGGAEDGGVDAFVADGGVDAPAEPDAGFDAAFDSATDAFRPDRSRFIEGIRPGNAWQDVTASLGANLEIDPSAVSYSGGGTANARTVVLGGGHNNGFNDAVAILDWRAFESTGWYEEFPSTADVLGVDDRDYAAIADALHANYDPATPGGFRAFGGRAGGALSRHTYDHVVVMDDAFYIFGGILPFDNPGQGAAPWGNTEADIWRYDFGVGWTYLDQYRTGYHEGHGAAALDTRTGRIWFHDYEELRAWDPDTGEYANTGTYLNGQSIESSLNFNPDEGDQGTLFGGGNYGGDDWWEYDIATGRETSMGRIPGSRHSTYIYYVPAEYGASYGTYFATVPADGTLRRWTGDAWETIASGGPSTDDYVYGRTGFEPHHGVFYWIHHPYTSGGWQTWVVRPFSL